MLEQFEVIVMQPDLFLIYSGGLIKLPKELLKLSSGVEWLNTATCFSQAAVDQPSFHALGPSAQKEKIPQKHKGLNLWPALSSPPPFSSSLQMVERKGLRRRDLWGSPSWSLSSHFDDGGQPLSNKGAVKHAHQ